MRLITGIAITLLLIVSVATPEEFSLQAGMASYSNIDFSPIYAGVTYYPGYLGRTLFRPEVDLGFWRAEHNYDIRTSHSFFGYAPISPLRDIARGMYGGVRLAVDFERIARREGNPVWPSFGAGTMVQWTRETTAQLRYSLFGRFSVGVKQSSALFIEIEVQTETLGHGLQNENGLNRIAKLGYRFSAF